jgi:hypothetical protein
MQRHKQTRHKCGENEQTTKTSIQDRQYSRGDSNRETPTSSNRTNLVRQLAEKEFYAAYKICKHAQKLTLTNGDEFLTIRD